MGRGAGDRTGGPVNAGSVILRLVFAVMFAGVLVALAAKSAI
ncbi:MAG: hypothetical protein AAFQ45_09400 [Pseudomonadota bacterium]